MNDLVLMFFLFLPLHDDTVVLLHPICLVHRAALPNRRPNSAKDRNAFEKKSLTARAKLLLDTGQISYADIDIKELVDIIMKDLDDVSKEEHPVVLGYTCTHTYISYMGTHMENYYNSLWSWQKIAIRLIYESD